MKLAKETHEPLKVSKLQNASRAREANLIAEKKLADLIKHTYSTHFKRMNQPKNLRLLHRSAKCMINIFTKMYGWYHYPINLFLYNFHSPRSSKYTHFYGIYHINLQLNGYTKAVRFLRK